MILGIGVDIVSIDRFISKAGDYRWKSRIFSPKELALLADATAETIAARFAAKEAVFKALAMPLTLGTIRQIEIVRTKGNKPEVLLSGDLRNVFACLGAQSIHLSLSHEKNNAIAFVIIDI